MKTEDVMDEGLEFVKAQRMPDHGATQHIKAEEEGQVKLGGLREPTAEKLQRAIDTWISH
jgi:hypothetical protein